ncbi:MAG: hypothetical protein CL874_05805 [Dehalococcoidales bacterium]|nr:hypothetical protein [Dehalococcoidales bacterium]
MRSKVILINPRFTEEVTLFNLPIGILHLGSWLMKNGYEVKVIDALHSKNQSEFSMKLSQELDDAICVGLSVISTQIPSALMITGSVKAVNRNIPVIWGGAHPTLYPEQTAASELVDFVVAGEGEQPLLKILSALGSGTKIGKIVQSEDSIKMDELPWISPELVGDISPDMTLKKITEKTMYGFPILTGMGCPYHCTFCMNSVIDQKYKRRSATNILDNIQALAKNYAIERIWFVDENFFGDKRRAKEFVDGTLNRELKFKWFSGGRTTYFRDNYLGSEEFLNKVKESGCQVMGTGAESGSQRILDMVCKGTKVWDTINMAEKVSKSGMIANFSFMIGLPTETKAEYKMTLKLIDQIVKIDPRFYIFGPQIYRPYPGSVLYNECLKYGMKKPETLEEWADSPYIHFEFSKKSHFSKELYPWVLYDKDLTEIVFYATLMGKQPGNKIVTSILRAIGRWRCLNFNFRFPIEKKVYGLIRGSFIEILLRRWKFV